ncbi:unnamed protein product [Caenorhabditis brenneri]
MIFEASESSCQLFEFGQVSLVERIIYGGTRIAFKFDLGEESCPSSNPFLSSTPVSDYRITDNTLYTTTLSYDASTWNLDYSITSCPGNTSIFLRNTTAVCIGLFMFDNPYCNNQAQGSALCKDNNGTLTGPANSNEYAYIQEQTTASYNTSNQGNYKYLEYWIDGVGFPGMYNYAMEDPTHNGVSNYHWTTTPSGRGTGWCLYNPNPTGNYIYEIEWVLIEETRPMQSVIFLLISLVLQIAEAISNTTKIIQVFGKPIDFTSSKTLEQDWSTCQRTCMNDDNCVMIFEASESSCQLFEFGQVSFVERILYGENRVAFKFDLGEESCPSSNPFLSSTPVSDYRITDNTLYTTTLSFDSTNWNLDYSITTCPGNTSIFLRNTTAVCIGLFMFNNPYCNDQVHGSALCKTNNGTLTGPANSDEYAYIQGISVASYNTSNQGNWPYLAYWIDGVGFPGMYNYAMDDPTHNGVTNYHWTTTPSGRGTGWCLYNPNPTGNYIYEIECTNTICCNGQVCWRGSLCQVATNVQFGQVTSVERFSNGGSRVAFKIDLPGSTCSTSNPLLNSPFSWNRTSTVGIFTTTISLISENWKLSYKSTICPNNTRLVERDGKMICIGLFFFGPTICDNYAQASALCKANNGMLTGPANSNEYQIIQAQSNSSYTTIDTGGYTYLTYWIDGIILSDPNQYSFEDPTHYGIENYQWTDGVPFNKSTGYCLHSPNPLGNYISDYPCETQILATICWRGALCRVPTTVQVTY